MTKTNGPFALTKNEREVRLVYGIDPEVVPLPKGVAAEALPYRIALILDSYRSERKDMFFDAEMFIGLIGFMSSEVLGAPLQIDIDGKRLDTTPFARLREHYASDDPGEWDLPDSIIWQRAIGLPEPWHLVGGPMPYHDSYTISIYPQRDIFPALRDRLPEFVAAMGWLCRGWELENINGKP